MAPTEMLPICKAPKQFLKSQEISQPHSQCHTGSMFDSLFSASLLSMLCQPRVWFLFVLTCIVYHMFFQRLLKKKKWTLRIPSGSLAILLKSSAASSSPNMTSPVITSARSIIRLGRSRSIPARIITYVETTGFLEAKIANNSTCSGLETEGCTTSSHPIDHLSGFLWYSWEYRAQQVSPKSSKQQ